MQQSDSKPTCKKVEMAQSDQSLPYQTRLVPILLALHLPLQIRPQTLPQALAVLISSLGDMTEISSLRLQADLGLE